MTLEENRGDGQRRDRMKETADVRQSRLAFGEKAETTRNPVISGRAGARRGGGVPRSLVVHSEKRVDNFNPKELNRSGDSLYWYS